MTGKRLWAVCLTLLLCLGLAAPALAAEENFVIVDGNLQEYHGPGGEVVIPESVTWVGTSAFAYQEDITAVTFPAGLISVCDCAFYGCTGLSEVTIPKNVAEIGSSAFAYCTGLKRVTIEEPSNLSSIRGGAFAGCTSLSDVNIPHATTVEQEAFRDTPWQAERDREERGPILVGLVVGVALGSVAAAFIVKKRNTQKK